MFECSWHNWKRGWVFCALPNHNNVWPSISTWIAKIDPKTHLKCNIKNISIRRITPIWVFVLPWRWTLSEQRWLIRWLWWDVHQILGHFHYAGTTLIIGLEKPTAKYAYKMVYGQPYSGFWMVNTNFFFFFFLCQSISRH